MNPEQCNSRRKNQMLPRGGSVSHHQPYQVHCHGRKGWIINPQLQVSFSQTFVNYMFIVVLWGLVQQHSIYLKPPPRLCKSSSAVETDDTTHVPRRYEKFYYSHNEDFWREQASKPFQNALSKGRGKWLSFPMWLRVGPGWAVAEFA